MANTTNLNLENVLTTTQYIDSATTIPNGNIAKIDNAFGANPSTLTTSAKTIVPAINELRLSIVPTGTVLPYAGSTAPTDTLLCNGQAVSRATYSSLFAIIGTTYGSGNGTTTFNVPNCKGRVLAGLDTDYTEFNTLGKANSMNTRTHTLQTSEIPSHTHTQDSHSHTQDSHNHNVFKADSGGSNFGVGATYSGVSNLSNTTSGSSLFGVSDTKQPSINGTTATNQYTGGNGSHNNLQPYITLNYIIIAR